MNIPSQAMPGSTFDSQVIAPKAISAMDRFYWSVRRELWENRAIYLAPLAVAGLFIAGFLLSLSHLRQTMLTAAAAVNPMKQHEALAQPYGIAAGLIMGTGLLVAVFYCLDALYGERRERTILFWKSLPVSDLTTVLAKASIPLVIIPVLTFAITFAVQFIMLLLNSAVAAGSGQSVAALWEHLSFFRMSMLLLYHLVTVHVLSSAPLYGWLFLVSAWSRRAPFLWAVLPPLAIVYLEKITFNTTYFAGMLRYTVAGSGMEAVTAPGTLPMNPMTHITPWHFVVSPSLWMGLAVTAVFMAAAVRLRRYREPI